jgi:peptide-methionine (S)-S-oxide reductase
MFSLFRTKMINASEALPGREESCAVPANHFVNGNPLSPPFPESLETALFGMGCFWGAERIFWKLPGVFSTMAGYSGGFTANPTYEEVCSGRTGHNEVVQIWFDPAVIPYTQLLKVFWEQHNPTQGMRQGGDVGTQYRSGLYTYSEGQLAEAEETRNLFQKALKGKGAGTISTEIHKAGPFYYAEAYHQQYLAKNPGGYCGIGGMGITLPEMGKKSGGKKNIDYAVPGIARLLSGSPLDEVIMDPANPNLIVDKES